MEIGMKDDGKWTTEFWSTIVSAVMMVVLGLGLVAASDTTERAIINAIAAVLLFMTQATIVRLYIQGRQRLKSPPSPPPDFRTRILRLHDPSRG
jgi:hypothetical protein